MGDEGFRPNGYYYCFWTVLITEEAEYITTNQNKKASHNEMRINGEELRVTWIH